MEDKKLIATTVSMREKGLRRREEGETTSSQTTISIQGYQEESMKNLMIVDDGGRRLKHRTVDGEFRCV